MNCVHIYPWSNTELKLRATSSSHHGDPRSSLPRALPKVPTVQCGAGWNLGSSVTPAHPQVLDLPTGTKYWAPQHTRYPLGWEQRERGANLVLPLGEDHLGTMPPAPGKGSREANTYSLCD